ncbi:MAG: hypothetical protein GY730_08790 [bacterium]|nr:hypothetical protein [bacterium]
MSRFFSVLLFLLFQFNVPVAAESVPDAKGAGKAYIFSEYSEIVPGQTFLVAAQIRLPDGWHLYWKNPGFSGYPPKINWHLPEGFKVKALPWPYPEQFGKEPYISFGYYKQLTMLYSIEVTEEIDTVSDLKIKADIEWLSCHKNCVPENDSVELILKVSDKAVVNYRHKDLIENTKNKLPAGEYKWGIEPVISGNKLTIELRRPDGYTGKLKDMQFFPYQTKVIDFSVPQKMKKTGYGYVLELKLLETADKPLALRGVLVSNSGFDNSGTIKSLRIKEPVRAVNEKPATHSLYLILIFAFTGGILLNLMPCVLPVLSIKVLGFVQQSNAVARSGEKEYKPVLHALFFAAGVVITFWVMADIILILRLGGLYAGWGFQLQHPPFIIFLAFLFFIMSMSLFGFFDISLFPSWLSGRVSGKSGLLMSFLSGLLATIIATPCTAPFMGVALGVALAKSPLVTFSIFTFLGLGMAFPYVVLSANPELLKFIPRPGPWMVRFKQFLAFPVYGTVIWLSWVLGLQTDLGLVIRLWSALFFTGFAVWLLPLVENFKNYKKMIAKVILLLLIIYSFMNVIDNISRYSGDKTSGSDLDSGISWERFSQVEIEELNGKVEELKGNDSYVFIKFTAAWCITCKFNEVIFSSAKVEERFKQLDMTAIEVDWTKKDENTAKIIRSYGRSGVPLYILYRPGEEEPVILPEILTVSRLLDALEQGRD